MNRLSICRCTLKSSTVLLGLVWGAQLFAQSGQASAFVHGRSVNLAPSNPTTVAGVGSVTTYFSTFNGTGATPFYTTTGIVSGELRQRSGSTYEGGYFQATSTQIFDYGSYTVTMPATDADGNGIPDVLQYGYDGSFTASGSGTSGVVGAFSISIVFSRAANSANGSYAATTVNSAGQRNTVSGNYSLLSYRGSLSYTRGTTNTMAVSVTRLSDNALLTGSTTYTTSGADTISYAAFTARDPSGNSYQVRAGTLARTGNVYRGAMTVADGLPITPWTDYTQYVLDITDTTDTNGNGVPDFSDTALVAPTIVTQPRSLSVTAGQSASFTVVASGADSYQWLKNGTPISGATSAQFDLTNVQAADGASYSVRVTNPVGSVVSTGATLTVSTPLARPAFSSQPLSILVNRGSTIALSVTVTGSPTPTLQWRKNGVSISGATTRTLVMSAVTAADSGMYSCVATNSQGAVTSSSAQVSTVTPADGGGRLSNLSIRANAGEGASTLITGFTISGGIAKPLLIRASGPSLAQFGVTGFSVDPTLALYSGTKVIASNNDWSGDPTLKAAALSVGAFAFSGDASKDAALMSSSTLPGSYTVQVGGGGSPGVALAEVYDATPAALFAPGTSRLSNLSARTAVGRGADILIAGFVITGSTARTLLIRAVGPALVPFGVTGVLSDPKLELFSGSIRIDGNDNWGGATALVNAATSVGAFALPSASADAALLVTLPPGTYSAQVSGADNGTGIALLEVYDLPPVAVP